MIHKLKGIVCQPDEPVSIDAMNDAIGAAGSDMSEHHLKFRRINLHVSDRDLLHPVRRYARNTRGRDFVVGDIHGCFSMLDAALAARDFDPARDRLFSVGDLIDRGAESPSVLDAVQRHGIRAVRGNHEQEILDWARRTDIDPARVKAMRENPNHALAEWLHFDNRTSQLIYNGGQWFIEMYCEHPDKARDVERYFSSLPYAIEVETEHGLIGIVHAELPATHWSDGMALLGARRSSRVREITLWDRERWAGAGIKTHIGGVCAVVVGHTSWREVRVHGNVINIDTGAVYRWYGNLTVLDLADVPAMLVEGKNE
ncbi:metallophosphoesterase [Paraburkholderia caribensis]|uniref:metallophosphoesterase n=1 Tax=Paraburkholderia caribensis TaxID=75105 RepID=UPI0028637781|nr:metallophosphoesterase [Paraburkholderia caribensis]MDR6382143.1 serine/threonine protein phosphatase 1 [Paraburkholderia caribensis]